MIFLLTLSKINLLDFYLPKFYSTHHENKNDKQYDKLESIDYFKNHSGILKIDFMYYLKLLVNPVDEILNVAFQDNVKFKKNFIEEQYKIRKNRVKLLEDLKSLFEPKLKFK